MDSRPDRLKDAYRRIEIYWEGDMRFYRGTVLGFHASSGAHIIRYDDGQRTRENLSVSVWLSFVSMSLQTSSVDQVVEFSDRQ